MAREYILHVRRPLLDAQPAEPIKRAAPRICNGPKPRSHNARPAVREPDWVVLEVRRAHEAGGMPPRLIPPHMASLGYDIGPDRVRALLNYTSRIHLSPDPKRTTPYQPESQA